jgi:hypothetical protein
MVSNAARYVGRTLLALLFTSACGQRASGFVVDPTVKTVEPHVTFVSAGGYWESERRYGHYRVVVVTHCADYCTEDVFLEQIDFGSIVAGIVHAVSVPQTKPLKVVNAAFYPDLKWQNQIELHLADVRHEQFSRLCLTIAAGLELSSRSGPCERLPARPPRTYGGIKATPFW